MQNVNLKKGLLNDIKCSFILLKHHYAKYLHIS